MARRRSRRITRSVEGGSRAGRGLREIAIAAAMPRPLATALQLGALFRGFEARAPSDSQIRRLASRRIRLRLAGFSETRRRYDQFNRAERVKFFERERQRLLRDVMDRRTRYCAQRARRRAVMFALRKAGVSGGRYRRMMRGARHTERSEASCR